MRAGHLIGLRDGEVLGRVVAHVPNVTNTATDRKDDERGRVIIAIEQAD